MCAKVMKKSVIANFYQFVFAICQKVGIANNLQPPLSLFYGQFPILQCRLGVCRI